jgi:hypothetical protein
MGRCEALRGFTLPSREVVMLFWIARDVTRAAARSGRQRKPAQPKPAGPAFTGAAKVFLVLFVIAAAGLAELFEKYMHAGRGAAALMSFAVLVLVLAPLAMAGSGNGHRTSSQAAQIRAAHARQEAARRARNRLPAEMEEAAKEADEWNAAQSKSSNERSRR